LAADAFAQAFDERLGGWAEEAVDDDASGSSRGRFAR
jgi:hypothetical protein